MSSQKLKRKKGKKKRKESTPHYKSLYMIREEEILGWGSARWIYVSKQLHNAKSFWGGRVIDIRTSWMILKASFTANGMIPGDL